MNTLSEQVWDLLNAAAEKGWSEQSFLEKFSLEFQGTEIAGRGPSYARAIFQIGMSIYFLKRNLLSRDDPDVLLILPYWQYRTQEDGSVCKSCSALNLFTARGDDPVWALIYPPNEPGCRCTIHSLLRREGEAILGRDLEVPGLLRLPAAFDASYVPNGATTPKEKLDRLAESVLEVAGRYGAWVDHVHSELESEE